ncbi:hypothetical protein XH83_16585 [Bradyrhizobium sp. CCBAU 53351]|nr:hypothetical protein XH83_16585 [Bradyrhizobium sp. CCBAU 53351]
MRCKYVSRPLCHRLVSPDLETAPEVAVRCVLAQQRTVDRTLLRICNPESLPGWILDCFAALAMTEDEAASCFSK